MPEQRIHLIQRRSLAMPSERASCTLVGREYELDLLRTKLRDAIAARGNVVLLGGEPGIGKTRLAEEVAFDAAQHGMLVVWGRCWESDGAPPFWPWIELLRDVMRNCDRSALQHQLGNGASIDCDAGARDSRATVRICQRCRNSIRWRPAFGSSTQSRALPKHLLHSPMLPG